MLEAVVVLLAAMVLVLLLYVPWCVQAYKVFYRVVLAALFLALSAMYFTPGSGWGYLIVADASLVLFLIYKDYWRWVKGRPCRRATASGT
jgi:hypothetical protein